MSLPNLPLSLAGYAPTEAAHRALNAIVAKYGQQCRAAALEEAAVGLETGDVSGLKDDAFMRSYTTHLLVSFAKHFRSLK